MSTRIYKSNRRFQIPLEHGRHRLMWSDEEYNFVRANHSKKTDEEIGVILKRSKFSVQMCRYKLGLLKPRFKPYAKYVIENGFLERKMILKIHDKITRMRKLIALAENEANTYKKEKYKQELKKLSGL